MLCFCYQKKSFTKYLCQKSFLAQIFYNFLQFWKFKKFIQYFHFTRNEYGISFCYDVLSNLAICFNDWFTRSLAIFWVANLLLTYWGRYLAAFFNKNYGYIECDYAFSSISLIKSLISLNYYIEKNGVLCRRYWIYFNHWNDLISLKQLNYFNSLNEWNRMYFIKIK